MCQQVVPMLLICAINIKNCLIYQLLYDLFQNHFCSSICFKHNNTHAHTNHNNPWQSQELNMGPLTLQSGALPQDHQDIWAYGHSFICFIFMCRNTNKVKFAGHTVLTKSFFCYILTYMDKYIWQFLIFTMVRSTALACLYGTNVRSGIKRYRQPL